MDTSVEDLAILPEVRRHLAAPNTGVYIVEQDGHIVWASASMQAVTGRRAENIIGKNGWDVFVRPQDVPAVAGFKAHLSVSDGTVWLQDRDGDTRWFRIDTWVRNGHIFCAFHVERDPREQHFHYVMRPKSAA